MTKRALLIASSVHARMGIDSDMELMTQCLLEYGFEKGAIAVAPRPTTRASILSSLAALIERTQPGDTVVVYYTGHGGVARFNGPLAGLAGSERVWRYLVPEAGHSAKDNRFGGVLDVELSHLLGTQLSRKCSNVTIILECCFAGGMMPRLADEGRRGFLDPARFDIPDEFRVPGELALDWSRLAEDSMVESGGSGVQRSQPVILAATSAARLSYETPPNGQAADFTRALVGALRRHRGDRVSWGELIPEIRLQTQFEGQRTSQRPHLIGPRGRVVFGTETVELSRQFDVLVGPEGQLRLLAGAIHGIHVGDAFELVVRGRGQRLGGARVGAVELARADLVAEDPSATVALEPGESPVALLRRSTRPSRVALEPLSGPSRTLETLDRALTDSPWLKRSVEPDGATFRVACDRGRLRVEGTGAARRWLPSSPRAELAGDVLSPVPWVVHDLEALTRARAFVRACAEAPPPPPEVELAVMTDAGPLMDGGMLRSGQSIRFVARYRRARPANHLFVSVVNVGLDGRACCLNAQLGNRGGINLFAEWEKGNPEGDSFEMSWAEEVLRRPTEESIYFVVSSAELELDCLDLVDLEALDDEHAATPLGSRAAPVGTLTKLSAPIQIWVRQIRFTLEPQ
ncbi:hypothetical protein PPSIR1_20904 [Plesiocystis pacifica SIR-1]|uniref:Peptidase C14 caspase domain-containing protein n=1 Tax=Plesiocystis pacifica SIR-1 TaxID=391625 RepID=A6G3C0_9BACT|nr:caspase family protein [Plesiocystis pacifica]EDM79527.1 hypothetical protein PPSIR1_20904 [Plesiocystis pacifica SIR-1]